MRIGEIPNLTYSPQALQRTAPEAKTAPTSQPSAASSLPPGTEATQPFTDKISQAIDSVGAQQKTASDLAVKVAAGNTDDTHKAVIAMEHALMSLDFTIQVRNKMLEAYQEIMKTQM